MNLSSPGGAAESSLDEIEEYIDEDAFKKRIVVIGGSGHIGSYLCPMLAERSNDTIICVGRSKNRKPYPAAGGSWDKVQRIAIDRGHNEEEFVRQICGLKPTILIDLICFSLRSCTVLLETLRRECPSLKHLLHCGSIWVYGHAITVPTSEHEGMRSPPFGEYGIEKKAIQDYLIAEQEKTSFSLTVLHPGHLVGVGWPPLNPEGHFDPRVFGKLRDGKILHIPSSRGFETFHHVHCEDVARAFIGAMRRPQVARGQVFNVVANQALTVRGYAEAISQRLFNKDCALEFLDWESFRKKVGEERAAMAKDHFDHSPNCSAKKIHKMLDVKPKYSSLAAISESVEWMCQKNVLETIAYPGMQTTVPDQQRSVDAGALSGESESKTKTSAKRKGSKGKAKTRAAIGSAKSERVSSKMANRTCSNN